MKPDRIKPFLYPNDANVTSMNKPTNVDDSDNENDSGLPGFLVNRSGFPLDDVTWEKMWDYAARNHSDGYQMATKIRLAKDIQNVPIPQAPIKLSKTVRVPQKVKIIQDYMNNLQYNHTGTQLFDIKKYRPICGLMEVAKDMIRESLPIKCLEAFILGLYLTSGINGMERFPIGFKTTFNGTAHRHVVLGLYYGGFFGCLGMSRREDLMYKPLVFRTLSDMLFDFIQKYMKYSHCVKKLKIGWAVTHDLHSNECIQWKALTLNMNKLTDTDMATSVEKHSRVMKSNIRNVHSMTSTYKSSLPLPPSSREATKSCLNHSREVTMTSLTRSREGTKSSLLSRSREASPNKLL